jgi:hypothetical protein
VVAFDVRESRRLKRRAGWPPGYEFSIDALVEYKSSGSGVRLRCDAEENEFRRDRTARAPWWAGA